MRQTVLAAFGERDEALKAFGAIQQSGVAPEDITLMTPADVPAGEHGSAGSAGQIATSGLLGGVGGFVAGLAALTLPGIGLILAAGPIAVALGGAAVGVVAGGIAGALTEHGVPEDEARRYEELMRQGATLLAVQVESGAEADIREILSRFGGQSQPAA